jgi:hypothetical protein
MKGTSFPATWAIQRMPPIRTRPDHQGHRDARPELGNGKRAAAERVGHRIGLDHIADTESGECAEDRECGAEPEPSPPQPVLDVVHGSADIVALLVDLPILDRQYTLGVFGRHPDEGRTPHPEERTGAADRDRRGDAGDVAGPDRRRKRGHQGVEGRDIALALRLSAGPQHAEAVTELEYGHQAQTDHQEQTRSQDQDQHGGAPNETVDRADPILDHLHLSPPQFS